MKVFFAVIAVIAAFVLGIGGTLFLEKRLSEKKPTAPEEP